MLFPNRFLAVVLSACLAASSAAADCPYDFEDVLGFPEWRRFGEIVRSVAMQNHCAAVPFGYVLSEQVQYLGDSEERRIIYDCIFQVSQAVVVDQDIESAFGSRTDEYVANENERFREAVFGLMSDEDLREHGIDPDSEVPSIFVPELAPAAGTFDTMLCQAIGQGCELVQNELDLVFDFEKRWVEGDGLVVYSSIPKGISGCPDWQTRMDLVFTGEIVGDRGDEVRGRVTVRATVNGHSKSHKTGKCSDFVREARMDGMWEANLSEENVTGSVTVEGGPVTFTLEGVQLPDETRVSR